MARIEANLTRKVLVLIQQGTFFSVFGIPLTQIDAEKGPRKRATQIPKRTHSFKFLKCHTDLLNVLNIKQVEVVR